MVVSPVQDNISPVAPAGIIKVAELQYQHHAGCHKVSENSLFRVVKNISAIEPFMRGVLFIFRLMLKRYVA